MPGKVRVLGMYTKVTFGEAINTTSKSGQWSDLSPFNLGPCPLYRTINGGFTAANMENGWQFAKVYAIHADANGNPTQAYWDWAVKGWADPKPHRYPMGRGAKPLYSLWFNAKLGYIDARRVIYGPLYGRAVRQTAGFAELQEMVNSGRDVTLRDYDGYDHEALNMSLTDVLDNPKKKMGHAFVLKALLTNDPVLQTFGL